MSQGLDPDEFRRQYQNEPSIPETSDPPKPESHLVETLILLDDFVSENSDFEIFHHVQIDGNPAIGIAYKPEGSNGVRITHWLEFKQEVLTRVCKIDRQWKDSATGKYRVNPEYKEWTNEIKLYHHKFEKGYHYPNPVSAIQQLKRELSDPHSFGPVVDTRIWSTHSQDIAKGRYRYYKIGTWMGGDGPTIFMDTRTNPDSKWRREGTHDLFTDKHDPDCPQAIKDMNGDIVLQCCRICGKYEAGLSNPCHDILIYDDVELRQFIYDRRTVQNWLYGIHPEFKLYGSDDLDFIHRDNAQYRFETPAYREQKEEERRVQREREGVSGRSPYIDRTIRDAINNDFS